MNDKLLSSILFVLLTLGPVSLQSLPDTIEITSDFRSINVIDYGEVTIGPKQVQDLDTASWQPTHGKYFTVPADRTGWLRLHLSNSDSLDRFLELYLHSITVNYVNIYVFRNGQVDYTAETGNQVHWKDRATTRRDMSLPFVVHAGEEVVVYVSVFRREFIERFSFNLADVRYGDGTFWQDSLAFLDFGYVISIFILVFFAAIRPKRMVPYLLYALYILGGGLYLFSSFGYLVYVSPTHVGFIEVIPVVFATISLLSFIFFAKNLLGNDVIPSWFLLVIVWLTPVIALAQLAYCYLFATYTPIPLVSYRNFTIFSSGWLLFIFFGIMVLAGVQVFWKKNREYAWFLGTFTSLFLLVMMSVTLEYELLVLNQGEEIFLEFIFVTLEITVTLIFFIYYILKELEKEKEDKLKAVVKAKDQARYFSNMLHSRVRSLLQSVSIDLQRGSDRKSVLVQVDELINFCELTDAFTKNPYQDLYSLLKKAAFLNRSVLNNDLLERSFYTKLDKGLKGVELINAKYIDLLHQFIHDSVSNIKKYADYKYAVLSAKRESGTKGEELVKVEIKDDGVGVARTLKIPQDTITLDAGNFKSFSDAFIGSEHTGLRRLFKAAKKADVRLELKSDAATGTSVAIFLQIQDRKLFEM